MVSYWIRSRSSFVRAFFAILAFFTPFSISLRRLRCSPAFVATSSLSLHALRPPRVFSTVSLHSFVPVLFVRCVVVYVVPSRVRCRCRIVLLSRLASLLYLLVYSPPSYPTMFTDSIRLVLCLRRTPIFLLLRLYTALTSSISCPSSLRWQFSSKLVNVSRDPISFSLGLDDHCRIWRPRPVLHLIDVVEMVFHDV
jgi:hypothetical protein